MNVGIVGGGITGLTTAYRLLQAGHQATIFEAATALGGLASSTQVQGVWVDRFYHCILPSDTALLSLVAEIGLGGDIYWRDTEMGFLHQGRMYPLTTARDLLRFSPLSLTDRLRLGFTGLYTRRLRSWQALEQVTARDWLVRFCGERAFNTVWKPLLVFKFGDRWREAPATYLWARVKRQGTTRQGGSAKERLAYVKGGFKAVVERLADKVRRLGGTIETATAVDCIEADQSAVQGLTVRGGFRPFDKVVATIPLAQFLRLIDPGLLGQPLQPDTIAYQAAVCLMLVLKEPLSRYYWIPVVDSGASFSGIVETTNLIRSDDLNGVHLVYLVNYVPREDPLFSADPDALTARLTGELERLIPTFTTAQILEWHIFRAAFVEPVWTLDYSARMPRRAFLNDSLFLLTTAQLYPAINSTSSCVQQVADVLDRLMSPNGSPLPRRST
jgi:protoporphyrinogen oxidase